MRIKFPSKLDGFNSTTLRGFFIKPNVPSLIPITCHLYLLTARIVAARITAFKPAQSPPLVKIPIFFTISVLYTNTEKEKIFNKLNTTNQKMERRELLIKQLKEFQEEHRDLDAILIQLQEKQTIDFIQIKRLKKRKLLLKDKIRSLKNKIEPDIIA